ncbi:MAG: lipopolysaccharide biosynthesis protein [Actinomycetota bacterium]|nr:lipopolysaccharide biosynthesis protein [Actinomycetota bacterium]
MTHHDDPIVEEEFGSAVAGVSSEEALTVRTARGAAWTGIAQLIAQPLTILVGVALARLLSPADFGLTGMAAIYLGLVGLVNEFGLTSAVIQAPDLSEERLSSIFWLNMAIGLVSALFVAASSLPLAAYFHEPRLKQIVLVLSLSFLLASVPAIHSALLNRRMQFRALAAFQLAGTVLGSVMSVGMAFAGAGVWSLVVPGMVAGTLPSVLIWRHADWTPRLEFRWDECRSLAKFGASVTGSGLFNYGYTNTDYLVVGRQFGAGVLGAYTLAYNLVMFPFRKVSQTLSAAIFPAFSSVQNDIERMARAYLRTSRWLAILTWAPLAAAAVLGHQLIVGLYGPKWAAAVVPFQILCLAGAQRSVGTIVGVVMRSRGRPDIELRWSMTAFGLLLVSVLFAARWGVTGVAVAVVITALGLAPFIQASALKMIRTPFSTYLLELAPGAVLGLVSAVVALACRLSLGFLPDLVLAAIGLSTAMLAALCVAYFGWRNDVQEIASLARQVVRRRQADPA